MAKAHLLVSVLTLIVALVHGQEAFPEQELQVKSDVVEVASKDFLEEDQSLYNDLLLLGSVTSRADCVQKKKCRNKGGTCQKKGEACPGKIVKGCAKAKGCSCCLPEEIICKRSKKCKKANGTCVKRDECYGKIIAKGCKKTKICKKTHVCCVEDESVTCRGGPGCPNTDGCPNNNFITNNVCEDCNDNSTEKAPKAFTSGRSNVYVFAGTEFGGTIPISYDKEGVSCIIKNRVRTWYCTKNNKGKKKCYSKGYCTGKSSLADGTFDPDSLKCHCPNPKFEKKHVCPECKDGPAALKYTQDNRPTEDATINTVFINQDVAYDEETIEGVEMCIIKGPVEAYYITQNDAGQWANYEDLGNCTKINSLLTTGHLNSKDCKKNAV